MCMKYIPTLDVSEIMVILILIYAGPFQSHPKNGLKAWLPSTKLIYFGAGCTRLGRRLKIDAAVLGNHAFNPFFE